MNTSINRLDSSMVAPLQTIHEPQQLPPGAPFYRQQSGITLIEIMIALLIGAFLLGGVLQIFSASKQTYRMQEGLSRLQENGRFALDFLSRDIRMAGFAACLDPTFAVPAVIAGTNNAGLNGSDTITIQLSNDACAVPVAATPVATVIYSVQAGAGGQPALFKNDGGAQELVEGIENMQILYGEDTDMNPVAGTSTDYVPDYYVAADAVGDMRRVVSIRISLLAATVDNNVTAQPISYTYNGVVTAVPADRKIRRVFNTTVALRNRLP